MYLSGINIEILIYKIISDLAQHEILLSSGHDLCP